MVAFDDARRRLVIAAGSAGTGLLFALASAGLALAAEKATAKVRKKRWARSKTDKGILSGDIEPLAHALESFVLMYQNHAAREDTIVFPAWKEALSERQLHEMSEKFEDIEHQQFGKDGYEDAVTQIGRSLGLADLAQYTAPPPPKA